MTTLTDDELLAWLANICFSQAANDGPWKDESVECLQRFRELLAQKEWQPIDENTPTDRPILGYGIWQGEINGIGEFPEFAVIEGGPGKSDHSDKSGWWMCTDADAYAAWLKPTHWRSLPAPPKDG